VILNAGQIVPTTTLKDRVWGKPVSDAALAVYIHRLREKLEPDPGHPVYIETIKGLGYRFNGKPSRASLALLKYGCDCAEGVGR
jgi:two-component system response regulator RegX3